MIYDFRFLNTSEDADFFLYLLASQANNLNLEAFFYTQDSHTHCIIPDLSAIIESYLQSQATQNHQTPQTSQDSIQSAPTHTAQTNILPHTFTLYRNSQNIVDSQKILDFANDISLTLPLSLYFTFKEITPISPNQAFFKKLSLQESNHAKESNESSHTHENLTQILSLALLELLPCPTLFSSSQIIALFNTPKTYYYTPLQTSQILNPKSDAFAFLNPPLSITHKPLASQDRVYFLQILHALKDNQQVPLHTQRGIVSLSLTPTPNTHTTLTCDIASLKTYFRIHKAQIDVLASFEKPLTHLVPKEVFEKHFPLNATGLVKVGLPYDMPLAIIGALLLQDDIGYFFLSTPSQDSKPPFDFCHSPAPKEQILTISQSGIFIDNRIATSHTLTSLVQEHITDLTQRHLVIYLSTRHKSAFLVYEDTPKVLLDIHFESNPKLILQNIATSYKSGDNLIKNFTSRFPHLIESINALPDLEQPTSNLIDIFDSAAFTLGFSTNGASDKNALFYRAYRFVRERGPRIDYTLLREDNALSLDYHRIIRSSISFKCADMEDEILSYGILDSLSEFIATLVRDTKTNLQIKKVLLLGDMLSNNIFLDRILGYLPKDIHLILPKDGLLDY
ncbi:hypothetical protein HCN_1171 [Helicobacter cinaedi PAGU611]|uniref:hypothetical protein n=1 Tax=Helicobacter cinaedi TaxID=213 RepID=UPI00025D34B3|nr:hypothetical protein [Helicobacter cinaedi]BAM12386.1 hypothetical protein HCN_1171 [Helicobacter cinaedi PAGU611]